MSDEEDEIQDSEQEDSQPDDPDQEQQDQDQDQDDDEQDDASDDDDDDDQEEQAQSQQTSEIKDPPSFGIPNDKTPTYYPSPGDLISSILGDLQDMSTDVESLIDTFPSKNKRMPKLYQKEVPKRKYYRSDPEPPPPLLQRIGTPIDTESQNEMRDEGFQVDLQPQQQKILIPKPIYKASEQSLNYMERLQRENNSQRRWVTKNEEGHNKDKFLRKGKHISNDEIDRAMRVLMAMKN